MKLSFLANDMMQGYNPLEIVRTAKLPFATVQMISDFSASFMEVMGQGVIRGRRTRSGMLPGQLELSKNVPFWSVQYELNRYGLIK
jgi:L-serine deaminase